MSIADDMRRCGYNGWAMEVERLEAERDVLATHLEAAGPHVTAYCNFESSPHEFAVAMVEWERSSPATSLARQKLLWQAEALERLLPYLTDKKLVRARVLIKTALIELRRQAGENE